MGKSNFRDQKDFDKWNKQKKRLDKEVKTPGFYEREIWFCASGKNIGFEQNGVGPEFLRPVLIVKKFNKKIFWAVPLTRTDKKNEFYFHFSFKPNETSAAVLSQIRLLDAKRLKYKAGHMKKDDFKKLKERLRAFLR